MAVTTSPPARRLRADGRDRRLAVGVGLVVVSVVLGARLRLALRGVTVELLAALAALRAS
jgi:hypothetical protein